MPEIIASYVTQATLGFYDAVNTSNSLPDKMKAIGTQVAREFQLASTKYQLTYTSPMPPGSPVVVVVQRPGVKFEVSETRLR